MHESSYLPKSNSNDTFKVFLNVFLIVTTLAALAEILFSWGGLMQYRPYFKYVAEIFFFNILHITLTFLNIRYVPEFKSIGERYFFNKYTYPIVFASLFSVFFFSMTEAVSTGLGEVRNFFSSSAVTYFFLLLPNWHVIQQHLGLSKVQNFELRTQGLISQEQESLLAKIETWLVRIIFMSKIAFAAWIIEGSSVYYELSIIFVYLGAAVLGYLVWFIRSSSSFKSKFLFYSRYLLSLLTPVSVIALYANLSIHGLDYLLVNKTIVKNSSKVPIFKYVSIFVIFCVLIGLISLYTIFPRAFDVKNIFVYNMTVSVLLACAYFHYILDGVFFRLKDSEVRRQIGPLLCESKPNVIR